MSEVVMKDVDGGIAVLTLNRPDRLNAWTREMEVHYFGLLDECAASEHVRVIVVTGAGRGFCAGADMKDLQDLGSAEDANGRAAQENAERTPQNHPLSIPKPIIAAINGPCAGIGLVQALMCDIRFAASGAKLTTAFARRGLWPSTASPGSCRGWSGPRGRSTCCSPGGWCSPRRPTSSASSTA